MHRSLSSSRLMFIVVCFASPNTGARCRHRSAKLLSRFCLKSIAFRLPCPVSARLRLVLRSGCRLRHLPRPLPRPRR
jgi:hypothetical protein